MSLRMVNSATDAPFTTYMVAAPCRADVLSGALRSAYGDPVARPIAQPVDRIDPFADLLRSLDRIESVPNRA